MFRHLLRNTVISAIAYFLASFLALLLVPVLIDAYGMVLFGLIVLARSLLPYGLLGLFDLGFSELMTQAVGRARVDADWGRAGRNLNFLLLVSGTVGACLMLFMWCTAPSMAGWLQTPPEQHATFIWALRITGVSLMVIFPGLVLEGIAKGFEAYGVLRGIEVLSNLAYVCGAAACVMTDLGYQWVIYALLASSLARYVALAVAVRRLAQSHGLRMKGANREDRSELVQRLRAMAFNRLVGTLERHAAAPLIGMVLGPAATAAYDVLVRIPRFLRIIVDLLTSSLIPVAARIEAAADSSGMRRLGTYTMMASAVVTLPPLAAAAVYSEPLLRLWINPQIAAAWHWQAILFLEPAAGALAGAGATALIVRNQAFSRLNILNGWRLLIQYGIAFSTLPWLKERGFMLGQALATAICFRWQLKLIREEQDLPDHALRKLWKIPAIGAAWIAVGLVSQQFYPIQSWAGLIGMASVWTLLYQLAIFRAVFSLEERQRIFEVARSLRRY